MNEGGFLVFCDADAGGNITGFVAGAKVIPDRQYEYFFFLAEAIDPSEYRIENSILVAKGGTSG
jgi:hypothetical protein